MPLPTKGVKWYKKHQFFAFISCTSRRKGQLFNEGYHVSYKMWCLKKSKSLYFINYRSRWIRLFKKKKKKIFVEILTIPLALVLISMLAFFDGLFEIDLVLIQVYERCLQFAFFLFFKLSWKVVYLCWYVWTKTCTQPAQFGFKLSIHPSGWYQKINTQSIKTIFTIYVPFFFPFTTRFYVSNFFVC